MSDPLVADVSQWRNPHFIQDVEEGTTELTVTLPPISATDAVCFFLADPARATVRRVRYLIGGKDGKGKFNSAFLTGLHPDWNWRYEIAFAVPEFGTGQSWLLCHRDSDNNRNSLLLLAVRGANGDANDKRMRFGYGVGNGDIETEQPISENVIYQAVIDGRTCVYSNLTDVVAFETVRATATSSTYAYEKYNLCFGASVNGTTFNANDGCSFAQVYSFKAWNGAGELVADYRPVAQGSVAGFFDVVTKTLFKSGDGFSAEFTPYVASDEALPIDTLTAHLGELVAVSRTIAMAPCLCESESLPFVKDALPAYGEQPVMFGESVTFAAPTGEFIWKDETTKASYRVRSAGLRIDAYDPTKKEFVKGVPQWALSSYKYTRKSFVEGVRVVYLWDAEMLNRMDGRRADCLRLVSVGTRDDGKTEVGHGLFDTGIHPVPATTRVLMEVSFDTDSSSVASQDAASPCGSRRFFGVRDLGEHGVEDAIYQYNFQITRNRATTLRVDPCNYIDGNRSIRPGGEVVVDLTSFVRYQIDVNPTNTLISGNDGTAHVAETKNVSVARSSEPLNGKLYIFGSERGDDANAPLCVDYNNTRYYSFAIWQDGNTLTRDYVPCLDAGNRPAFYDRVAKDYIYPIGDKAVYEAEFAADAGPRSVQVLGEDDKGEPAAYLDPDGTPPGFYEVLPGASRTFAATDRRIFGCKVTGYRIDTWTEAGWAKGAVRRGRSVTLNGEDTVRRLVWIWKKAMGLVLLVN